MKLFRKYYLIKSLDGIHQIGGRKPDKFNFPENDFLGNFQYLGFLSKLDPWFGWLPFNLHLICPIYLNIDRIFLDYSNPFSPTLISPKNTAEISSEYDELTTDSYIAFQATKVCVSLPNKTDQLNAIGMVKKLNHMNFTKAPYCPISNRKMRFVVQLTTFGEIPAENKNFQSPYPDFDHLCFWGDGSLFVYMEPETKTVCYFIKNT